MRLVHAVSIASLGAALLACNSSSEEEPNAAGCVGGKCDDADPADFACQDLQNASTRRSEFVLAELNDPFANFVLKQGEEGCVSTRTEMMKRLRELDNDGCESAASGMRTAIVTEAGQLEPEGNPLFRAVTTRSCSGRSNHEMVFSIFGVGEGGLPESVEVMAFDDDAKEYNYYTVERNEVAFHGSSSDILREKATLPESQQSRCAACHTGGGLIMKELRNPWIHWTGSAQTPGSSPIIDAHDDLGSSSGGSSMESVTKTGNREWNATRIELMLKRDGDFQPAQMLQPLFCGSEFNLDSAGLRSNGGVDSLPANLFANCLLSNTSCESTHFGEFSGDVSIDKEVYAAAIADAGSTVPGTSANDTILGLTFVEPAVGDLNYLDQLQDRGVIDQDFLRDVLAVDFTRPVLSEARCDLLEFAPTWEQVDALVVPQAGGEEPPPSGESDTDTDGGSGTDGGSSSSTGGDGDGDGDGDGANAGLPAAIKAAFIANLEAGGVVEGEGAAGELLASLNNESDSGDHAEKVTSFVEACDAREDRALIDDVLAYVQLSLSEVRGHHVMEFPQTTQVYENINVGPNAHLDASTCALVE